MTDTLYFQIVNYKTGLDSTGILKPEWEFGQVWNTLNSARINIKSFPVDILVSIRRQNGDYLLDDNDWKSSMSYLGGLYK